MLLRLFNKTKREVPYILTRRVSDLVVEIEMPGKRKSTKMVHHNRIVPYVR